MMSILSWFLMVLAGVETPRRFGRVCVAHLPQAVTADFYRSVGAQRYPVGDVLHPPLVGSEFQVAIDARPPIPVGVRNAQWMDSLLMETNHSVRIRFLKKPATTFRFRFGQYRSADLCLYYKWDYDTWVLTEKKGKALGCDCP